MGRPQTQLSPLVKTIVEGVEKLGCEDMSAQGFLCLRSLFGGTQQTYFIEESLFLMSSIYLNNLAEIYS